MKLTNGKVTVEVPDHKADKFCVVLGMWPVDEVTPTVEAPKRRGRPKKEV